MKQKSLIRRATALLVALTLAIPMVYAHSGEVKLQTKQQLGQGLDYINTITVDGGGRQEAFALQLAPGGDVYPITLQASGTIYASASILKAVELAQSQGYRVLGVVNTDYFATSTGVPMGIVIEDGVLKSSPTAFPAVTFSDAGTGLVQAPHVNMTITNTRSGQQSAFTHFNKTRTATGGLYLYNEYFSTQSTRTNAPGWMVRMKVVEGEMTVSGTVTLEVVELLQSDAAVAIGPDNYILTATDSAGMGHIYEDFALGDRVTVTTSTTDQNLLDADWATGTGDLMVKDGSLTDTGSWQHVNEGRAPRTALGVRADGSTVFYVVDGRQSGYSTGLSQKELADEMIRQGCVWAVNLDGGGSSNLAVQTPGLSAAAVVNKPSDGKNRPCATFVLFVTKAQSDGWPSRLALKSDGPAVLTGSQIALDSGAVALDQAGVPLSVDLGQLTFTSEKGLGTFDGAVYTAGDTTGTDTVTFQSEALGIYGSAQIHVVGALSDLQVRRVDTGATLSTLSMMVGEQVQLGVTGSYWSRAALRQPSAAVTWTTASLQSPDHTKVGTVDASGVFTAGTEKGTLTVTAGGVSRTIDVVPRGVHNDVKEDHWAYTAVDYCYRQGIVGGVSASEFGVGQNIRRGDFIQMLYNAMGKPRVSTSVSFTDVAPTDYYAAAIAWAQENQLASGLGDGTFGAQSSITREQAFTILSKALPLFKITVPAGDLAVLNAFQDRDSIVDYARQPIATLVQYRIVSGAGGAIAPKGNLSRGEMASLLYKLGTYDPSAVDPVQPDQIPPTAITLDKSDVVLLPGERIQLTATLAPAGATGAVTWTSSNPTAAAVTADGTVTNVFAGVGQPVVTITATVGGLTATCTVRCRPDDGTTPPTVPETPVIPPVTPPVTPPVVPPVAQVPGPNDIVGTVTGAEGGLNLRTGPGTSNAALGKIPNGSRVSVVEKLEGWYKVSALLEGTVQTGYVSATYLTVPQTGVVTGAGQLNLRAGAATDQQILAKLPDGTRVTILEKPEGWYQVSATLSGQSLTGYVSAQYIKLDS